MGKISGEIERIVLEGSGSTLFDMWVDVHSATQGVANPGDFFATTNDMVRRKVLMRNDNCTPGIVTYRKCPEKVEITE